MNEEKVILGIDPGTTIMGYGLIRKMNKDPELITLGIIDLKKYADHYLKLQKIFERTLGLIDEFHPDELAKKIVRKYPKYTLVSDRYSSMGWYGD